MYAIRSYYDDLDIIISNHNPDIVCEQEITSNIGSTIISFPLNDNSTDYIYNKKTDWKVGLTFIYEGSNVWIPKKFSIIASMESSGDIGSARLFDQTNNKEICIITWTNESKILLSTETFYNLPNTETLIELQFKTSNKKNEVRLHYLALY